MRLMNKEGHIIDLSKNTLWWYNHFYMPGS